MPLLFSYGSLQEADVQIATFGRLLDGHRDSLPGYETSSVPIDGSRAEKSGRTHHANVVFNGRSESRVSGTVLEISDAELAAADRYEQLASYTRISALLASGKTAWIYVHAGAEPETRQDPAPHQGR